MSVSLTHVQAALQNQLTSGGSGPLTLNVLHKTDALISQLKALSHTKPLSVEVLKALPNGRAEVLTDGLKLDVKASLPLQKGEVLQLKLEQHGSAVRLVQTLGNAQGNSQGAVQGPAQGQVSQQANQGQSLGNGQQVWQQGAQTITQTSAQHSRVHVQSQVSNTAAHQGQNTALLVQQKAATAKSNSIQTGSDKNISSNQNTHSQNVSVTQTQARLPASHQAPLPQSNAGQALQQTQVQQISGNPALANSVGVKPGLANVQLTTSALIGVLAEALPASDKRQAGRADQQMAGQFALDGKGTKRSSLQGQQLNQNGATNNKQLAETVTAKYQTTSSLSVEEIQEVQQRQPAKAPDLSLDLPIAGEAKPVQVEFHIGPDPEQSHEESEGQDHSLRFSLETEGTGPVHASLTLSGQTVHVTLWAEDDEFAARLIEHRDLLDERLAAHGLDLNNLKIRHGLPPSRRGQDIAHVDANI